jgi:Glycosyl hydrolases family 18
VTHLFAPYVDMSITTDENLVSIQQQAGFTTVTLAFLDATNGCSVGWGGLGGTLPTDTLANGTSILSVVQSLQGAGVQVILSFGGANGTEPALNCTSASQLQALYQSVINRYHVTMLDFDIEGGATSNQTSITLRDQALIGLREANPSLVISYTLPVLPTGLINTGVNILISAKADGFDPDVINVMAMDYGSSSDNGGAMGTDATSAASATEAQIEAAGLSSTVGITPMIGVNDTNTEIFTLADAQTVLSFASTNSYVSRIAMWSLARDNGSCAGEDFASPSCSGLTQSNYQFSEAFKTY